MNTLEIAQEITNIERPFLVWDKDSKRLDAVDWTRISNENPELFKRYIALRQALRANRRLPVAPL